MNCVLIQAGGETLWYEIHELVNSVWTKEDLPDEWKEYIIVPVYKKVSKTDCSNCSEISLLSTSYKMLSSILSVSYKDENIWDH
jgi:ArsR family metal-binding transcriptional regulator